MVMDEEEERPFFGVVHIRIPPQCPSSSSPTETEMCYQYNAPADIAAVPCPMCKVFKPSAARYSRPRPRLHALTRPQLSPPPRRLLQQSQPSPHRRRPSQERRRCVPRPLTAPRPHTLHSKVLQRLRLLQGPLPLLSPIPPVLTPFRYSGLASTRNSPCTTTMAGPVAAVPPPKPNTGSYSPPTGPPSASCTASPCPQR